MSNYVIMQIREELDKAVNTQNWQKARGLIKEDIYIIDLLSNFTKKRDLRTIKFLIDCQPTFKNIEHIFKIATYANSLPIVQYAVEKYKQINFPDNLNLEMGLCNSVIAGNLPIVVYLIEKGALFNPNNNLMFQWACEANHLDIVEYFIFDLGYQLKDIEEIKNKLNNNTIVEIEKIFEKKKLKEKLDNNLSDTTSNMKKAKI